MNDFVNNHFKDGLKGYKDSSDVAPLSTQLYMNYNLFMYPAPGFYELYQQVCKAYREFSQDDQPAYLQAWVNVFKKGQHLGWHGHWPAEYEVWHGFYCVDVEPGSYTDYRIPVANQELRIDSEDNLLVLGKAENDQHKSSPWHVDHKPRVTIGFDIISWKNLNSFEAPNHWIPV